MRAVAIRNAGTLLLALFAVSAAAGSAGVVVANHATTNATATDLRTDHTTIRIEIQPSGRARWFVSMRFELETANETAAFDRLAAAFEDGNAGILSLETFRQASQLAEDTTDREMSIGAPQRIASRENGTGRLVLAFTWIGFARTTEERLVIGDAFRADSETGTWLPGLTSQQELVIEFPQRYQIVSSSRGLTNGTIHVEGPATFAPGKPSAVLESVEPPTTGQSVSPTTSSPASPTNGTPPSPSNGSPPTTESPTTSPPTDTPKGGGFPSLGILGLVVIVLAVSYLAWRRYGGRVATGRSEGPDDEEGGVTAETTGDDGEDEATATEDDGPEQLLSDEEQVMRLLAENDGRMKQARIVEETGWSNAKVSQLLSTMDEEGEIEKLRLGRENLISLPEEAPDGPE